MRDPAHFSISRVVKLGISMVVFAGAELGSLVRRLVGLRPRTRCVVLYYHSIADDQRINFANQLDTIVCRATAVSVSGELTLPTGARCVAVTFDDGFEDFLRNALPELQKRGVSSTMFVISGAIGKAFGPVERSEKVMSLEQIRSLPTEIVAIGSHTATHPLLPSIREEEALKELLDSRLELEKLLNRKIDLFSFPFGGFNERLVDLCRQAGYRRVFTTLPFVALEATDDFVLGRVRVDPTDWPLEFRLKISGAYRWLPLAFRWKHKMRTASIFRGSRSGTKKAKPQAAPQSMIREWVEP